MLAFTPEVERALRLFDATHELRGGRWLPVDGFWDPTRLDRRWQREDFDARTLEAFALLRSIHNDLAAPATKTEPIDEI